LFKKGEHSCSYITRFLRTNIFGANPPQGGMKSTNDPCLIGIKHAPQTCTVQTIFEFTRHGSAPRPQPRSSSRRGGRRLAR
jgi:hypothetical protein